MDERLISAASTRSYLVEDNGWSNQQVDTMFQGFGSFPRTERQWEDVIDREIARNQ